MATLIFPAINLLALIAILTWKFKGPLAGFVEGRHHSVARELSEVREKLKTAQAQLDEYTGRLRALDAEVRALREQTTRDAAEAKTRVLTEAKKVALHIVEEAKATSQNLYGDVKTELRHAFAGQVIERATQLIQGRLTAADRAKFRHDFSKQVETIQ